MKNIVSLSALAMLEYAGTIWFSCINFNQLCMIENHSEKVLMLGEFLNEKKEMAFLHSKAMGYKEKLFFSPNCSTGVDIYDIKCRQFRKIMLPDSLLDIKTGRTKTFSMQIVNGKLYIFGLFLPSIIIVDADDEIIENIIDLTHIFGKDFSNKWMVTFRKSTCVMGQKILGIAQNSILVYDTLNNDYKLYNTGDFYFDTICYAKEIIWLSAHDKIFSYENNKLVERLWLDEDIVFSDVIYGMDALFYMSNQKNYILKYDILNYTHQVIKSDSTCHELLQWGDGFFRYFNNMFLMKGNSVGVTLDKRNQILLYKDGNTELMEYKCLFSELEKLVDIEKMYFDELSRRGDDLEWFLWYIENKNI